MGKDTGASIRQGRAGNAGARPRFRMDGRYAPQAVKPVVGTAGWAIPRPAADAFGEGASNLARYATRFDGVEINSSFYRPHRRSTWERWRDSVPATFRFSVKVPKVISHERKLVDCAAPLARFFEEVGGLGDRLGVLLLQLPPTLAFDAATAADFFPLLVGGPAHVACEPRHPSWFDAEADALLRRFAVARVAADPAVTASGAVPGGWDGLGYHRLHGSPVTYRSSYDDGRLDGLARTLRAGERNGGQQWCIFDNTASGAATADALRLDALLADCSPDR